MIAFNPASLVTKQSEAGNERDRVITVDEETALQDACDEQDRVLGPILAMLMATGSRISEITGLRWRDVDMKNKTIRLSLSSTKNKQARTLFIAGRAWERLEEHSRVRPISDDSLVFRITRVLNTPPPERSGKPPTASVMNGSYLI